MTPVILYLLLAIIQGQGGHAEAFGTLQECQDQRELFRHHTATLALSDCVQVTLSPVLPTS